MRWIFKRRAHRISINGREALSGYLFIAPWLIGLGVFVAYPLLFTIYMSFNEVRVTNLGLQMKWVGFENLTNAFLKDNQFPILLVEELVRTLIAIPLIVMFALFVATLLNIKFPGRSVFRAFFFLPVIFSTGKVLNQLFFQGAGGLEVLEQYDVSGFILANFPKVLADPLLNVLNMIVIILWYSGVQVLLFLVGFQTIGAHVYEAARIDGSTMWMTFWKITLPGLKPFILLSIIFSIVDMSTFPFNGIMNYLIANMNTGGFGFISAIGLIYFLVVFMIIMGFLFIFRRLGGARGRG
ncbi:carbohydrate ABC transporter permease [Paenibacillus nasutitermitis]|uniref:ABC transporter permease n=1 Tax=Paenibacillus nasutitermitis TaxID=1652958 RepID=A0A917E1Q9_9BACL|nr:sugar ABC transporter permease [Paenibacillus nasutitermitis]GGD93483.1 ABC transporter permease [Paenibacillus nasutitermitis]